jgi:hypothetical protein
MLEPGDSAISNKTKKLATILFVFGLALYLLTRFIALDKFPIYFFSDEAIQTMTAKDLVSRGLRDVDGSHFPVYFENGGQYNLSLSVWLQVLISWLPNSVWLTRGLPALLSLLFPLFGGLYLRDHLKARFWWLMPYLVSLIPAWFLHSRTAFETALGASLYSLFLFLYANYRLKDRRWLIPALAAGALAFYSYSPLQLVVVLSGVLFLLMDWRYHFEEPKSWRRGLAALVLLAAPYFFFRLTHAEAFGQHLRIVHSYWVSGISLDEKLALFFARWLKGFNPLYWYFPNEHDLIRHLMKGYGHLPWLFLPFTLFGLWRCIRRRKEPANRALLIALLVAPSGASLVDLAITRLLVMVVPLALLTAIGVNEALVWLSAKIKDWRLPAIGMALALTAAAGWMTRDAILNGPTWYSDYSLYGMQWGGQQLSEKILEFKQAHPQRRLTLSPTWANNTDVIMRYFLGDPLPVEMGTLDGHNNYFLPFEDGEVFILPPEEFAALKENPKFADIEVLEMLAYPDGNPGFYFVSLDYAAGAEAIFAAELAERQQPQSGQVEIWAEVVQVTFPMLDIGEIADAFDGDRATLIRTFEANPLNLTLTFGNTIEIQAITVWLGNVRSAINVELIDDQGQHHKFEAFDTGMEAIHPVRLDFGEKLAVRSLNLRLESLDQREPVHVHLWDVEFE